ncbi:MAG: F0F1 ATP synthase subunit A, partial [Bacteroidia bacterium]|nr:F0F1 ATP synthase subunit A [Bacteroidia bacterium]
DIPKGNGDYIPIAIHLPWILYTNKGLQIFFLHGHSEAEIQKSAEEKGFRYEHGHLKSLDGSSVIDLSLTKTSLQWLIVAFVLLFLFTSVAQSYQKNKGAPKGIQSLLEPIIVFIRDEVAKPNLHGKHEKFLPYLLTLFFFIWFSNLFGLTPLNSNIAGNISVTAALALLTLIIVNFNGTKDYWGHIFWFPGVPLPVKFLMMIVEPIGVITKPFALMIRLFANIMSGHIIILSLVSMIFIVGNLAQSQLAGVAVSPISIAFSLFIMGLEVIVAIIQAYVFTLLTAVFLGAALEEHAHHDTHEEHSTHH